MTLSLQEAKQNSTESKERVANTYPPTKRSNFPVSPPAHFLVSFSLTSNSPKASPVWQFPSFNLQTRPFNQIHPCSLGVAARLGDPGRKPRPAGRGFRLPAPALRLVLAARRSGSLAGAPQRRGSLPALGKFTPTRAPGLPAYLLHLGCFSTGSHGRRAPASRPERTKGLRTGNAPPSPPRSRAAGSLPYGGQGCLRFPTPGRARPRPGQQPALLQRRLPGPSVYSDLKSSSHRANARAFTSSQFLPPRPQRPRLAQRKQNRLRVSFPVARDLLLRGDAARQPGQAGAGRRPGGPEPSLRTGGACLPARRTNQLRFIPAERARTSPIQRSGREDHISTHQGPGPLLGCGGLQSIF